MEMKSAGFVSFTNLTGQNALDGNTNQTMLLLQNKIRTLTTLSKNEFLKEEKLLSRKNLTFYLCSH